MAYTPAQIIDRFGQQIDVSIISTIGDNTIVTPASGKRFVFFPGGIGVTPATQETISVKLGSREIMKPKVVAANVTREINTFIEGRKDEALIVNLAAGSINVDVDLVLYEVI